MIACKLTSLLIVIFAAAELSLESFACPPVAPILSKIKKVFKRIYTEPKPVFKGCFKKMPANSYDSKSGSVSAVKELNWNKCHTHCYGPEGNAATSEEQIGMDENNCWCKYTFNRADQTTDGNCDISCAGNKKQSCGGKEFISVYSARIEKGNRRRRRRR